jgi:hypothetical protein
MILVFSTLMCASCTSADDAQVAPTTPSTRCAEGHPLSVTIPETFQHVPSHNPAVLCVFRNKNGGFPTFNIVVEPRLEDSKPPSLAEYIEGITKGYNTVGLTDAKLSNSEAGELSGIPFFSSDVRFTSNGTPMAARILVLQLHDRTYTASAINRADAPDFSQTALSDLTESITIEGASGASTHTASSSYRTLLQVILVLVIGLYAAARLVRKKTVK